MAVNGWKKEIEGYTSIVGNTSPFGTAGHRLRHAADATAMACRHCECTSAAQGNPNDAPVRVDQRQNTSELITLDGWEVTYVQPLDFLLQGAGFSMNYTHIDQKSEGGLPGAASSAITGLSPFTYNVTAFYENYGFSGRLMCSVRDAFIEFLGNNENNIAGRQLCPEAQVPGCVVQLQAAEGNGGLRSASSCRTSSTSSC